MIPGFWNEIIMRPRDCMQAGRFPFRPAGAAAAARFTRTSVPWKCCTGGLGVNLLVPATRDYFSEVSGRVQHSTVHWCG